MRRLYLVLGIAIVALGLFHIVSTPRFFDELFASFGLALVLLGALNLLNWSYGEVARGLVWTCAAANFVMLIFMTLGGYVDGAAASEMLTILGSLAVTTFLSIWLYARRTPDGVPSSAHADR